MLKAYKKDIHITVLPKKKEAGNPDFRIWDGKQHITGYIEAKDPTVENLDRIEETEQLKRYLHTFAKLILTNRKERTLTLDEIKHYCGIVTAINKTIEIQKEIDKVYDEIETSIL